MSEEPARYEVNEYLEGEETVRPQELVWGYVRDAAAPAPLHQQAVLDFAIAWQTYVADRRLGVVLISATDCVFDRERGLVVQPDVLFVSAARAHIVTDRVWGAPDLVLEVLSPKPRIGTLDERMQWFAAYGVRECWLYHQFARELEVVVFEAGAIEDRRRLGFNDRIISTVFTEFDGSCESIISSHYF
jgi:Uma2 family endonuclease